MIDVCWKLYQPQEVTHEHPCRSEECPMPETRRDKRGRYHHMSHVNAVYMFLGRQPTVTSNVEERDGEARLDKRSSRTCCSNILTGYSQDMHAHLRGYF